MSSGSRTALVTGGSGGIGRSICEQLLEAGHEVISLALHHELPAHPRLHTCDLDLGDREATGAVLRDLAAWFDIDTVVHNAGVICPAPLADVALNDLDRLMQLHVGCAVQLLQAALPAMRAQRFGRVVLLSSRAVLGLPTRTAYSASKAAMLGLARTWALELAGEGITVNVVAPGPVRTPMFHEQIEAGSEKERRLAAAIPVRRLGEPDDVARAVLFFADALNGFVTGQVLYVCGGTSVGSLTL